MKESPAQASAVSEVAPAPSIIKKQTKNLIDLSRANNIGTLSDLMNVFNTLAINLSRIKMSYNEIMDAIIRVDDVALSLENLLSLLQCVPTNEDVLHSPLARIFFIFLDPNRAVVRRKL